MNKKTLKAEREENLSTEEIAALEKILKKQSGGKIMIAEEFKKHLKKL